MTYSSALLGEESDPLTEAQLESGQRRKWEAFSI